MTTAATSLLGLALPVTGELSGTWGDTVNNSITSLLDTAIAGTTTLSTDGDVTLSTTTLAANQARQAILLCSGARTAIRTITAPAQSKIYTIINATTGGYAVKLVGVGPTTGLTIPNGASAVVAWNGSDFIEIGSSTIGNLTVNGNLTVTGTTTLSGGTANGVAYLNGSKVVTTGSALTFDGTNLTNTQTNASPIGLILNNSSASTSAGTRITFQYNGGATGYIGNQFDGTDFNNQYNANRFHIWLNAGSEQMRLTSTGLGIGTTSPRTKLNIAASTTPGGVITLENLATNNVSGDYLGKLQFYSNDASGNASGVRISIDALTEDNFGATSLVFSNAPSSTASLSERMRLDSSGNLGLGVTPSAWGSSKAIQLGSAASIFAVGSNSYIGANSYYNGTDNKYISNGYATLYSQQSDGAHKFYTAASGTAGTTATFTQAMTLDASGRLLVGTTTAISGSKLTLGDDSSSGATVRFSLTTAGTERGYMTMNGGTGELQVAAGYAGYGGFTTFYTAGSERARIDSSGNLLVGTTPSTASALGGGRLVLTSDGTNFAGTFYQSSTSSSVYTMRVRHDNTTSGAYIQFVTDSNVETGRIYDSAGTMQYASSSDARLKTNVQPMQNSLQSVLALNPCTFDMRRGEDTFIPSAGLIAQEVHEVYPYVVGVGGDDENTNPWSVDYGKLTPLLVAAIKEQQALITQLTERITALEGK